MQGQQPVIIWLNSVLIALTFAALCARVGRRVLVVGTFSWHDALITLAAVSATIFSIFQMVGTSYGIGLHQDDVDSARMPALIKLIIASNVFYFVCNWAVKHALLLFYSEITREKKFKGSIYLMHFVAFGFGLSSILVNIFQCRPIHKAWNSSVPGYCVNLHIFFRFNSVIMLATDLVLYIMPVVFTWHLQLRRPQRIGLNCLFALGGLVLAASAARVEAVDKYATSPDFTWWFSNAMIWSVLENHLAIVVACAPSVKVIALLLFPRLASTLSKLASRVTPTRSSRTRSRSRASAPYDLESGVTRKSDKLRPTPSSTPLPSPVLTRDTMGSGQSRASKNFAKWLKGPASPRLASADSMDRGLVNEHDTQSQSSGKDAVGLVEILRDNDEVKGSRELVTSLAPAAPEGGETNGDIRVEHTITVEDTSARASSDEESHIMGRAV